MITNHANQLRSVLETIDSHEASLDRLASILIEAFRSGKKLMTCGNGGSAAEAAHLAEEFTGRFWRERDSLPGMCLSIDGTLLTCIVNDYGQDEIFARQVSGLGQPGDVLVVFSSSGNSVNLIRVLEVARAKGITTVSLLGKGGGKTKGLADIEIIVDSDSTMRCQECHLFLLHMLCEKVERIWLEMD